MSHARFATAAITAAGILIAFAGVVSAQESGATVKKGSVSRDEFRIRRAAPSSNASSSSASSTPANKKLYATVEKNKVIPANKPLLPQNPVLDSLVEANDYATPAPPVRSPLPAAATMNAPKPASRYVWGQSAAGGYFEASGAFDHTIMGDELYKYGGKFMDGTVVPTTPVVCNFKGHVYRPYVVKR